MSRKVNVVSYTLALVAGLCFGSGIYIITNRG